MMRSTNRGQIHSKRAGSVSGIGVEAVDILFQHAVFPAREKTNKIGAFTMGYLG